jgi:hypothetical protein
MIRDPSLGYTYLMVDALDECQTDLDHLLKIIVDTSLDPSSRVKWLVSSRHKTSIDSSLNPIEQKIELDLEKDAKDRVSHAVDVYIDDKIGALFQKYINGLDSFGLPEDLMELQNIEHKVAKEVRSMANDTFLWVALVFRQIEKEDYSANEVLEAVREMPTDLDKMYERMMYQIVEQNQHKVKHCKQVLLIMASCYRPLRLAELALLAEIPNLGSPVKIIQLCGIFTMEQNHGVVNFVHQSAKDYLVDYMSPKLSSQIFPSGKEEGHRLIFSNSLNAMSKGLKRNIYNLKRADIHLEEIETPRIDPLASLKYSCVYWTDHLCQMINKIDGALDELDGVERFWEQKSIYWLEALILMKHLAAGMSAITSVLDILEVSQILFQGAGYLGM